MKRKADLFITVLLAATMICFIFGCGNNSQNDSGGDNTGEDKTVSEPAEEEVLLFPHESKDFEGGTFTVLIDVEPVNSLDLDDLDVEGVNGEILNDSYWNRKCYIEETYNITLKGVHVEGIASHATKTINSAIDDYDAFAPRLMNAAVFAAKGYGVDLFNTEYLTLGAPWWDQNIIRDTSIEGSLYFIAGDIFIKHYNGISLLLFNKKMLSDNGLENPYILVNENKWTLEKFAEMTKNMTRDLNGDGKMDKNDQFGFSTQADFLTSMLNSSGQKIVDKDKNDLPFFAANNEKTSIIIDRVLDIYVDNTYCLHRDAGAASMSQFFVFPEGRALFMWALPWYIDYGMRDMEDDFGILPLPKFEPSQERYYHNVNHWHSYTYMIPRSAGDFGKSAYIMDALAYQGRQSVLPAYYEVCLKRKYTRDEESEAMLDIIFSTTVYDMALMYDVGGWLGQMGNGLYKGDNLTASAYEKQAGKIEKDLQNLIEQFEVNKY